MERWPALALGSVLGGFARYFVGAAVFGLLGGSFPYGTLIVNLSGCFVLGLCDGAAGAGLLGGPAARLFVMTGFCGAYTTFSTLILETSNLARDGQFSRAAFNFLGSGALGLALLRLGAALAASLLPAAARVA